MLFLYYIIVAGFFITDTVSVEWTYQDQDWFWSKTCVKGTRQSPIALSRSTSKGFHFSPLRLQGYWQPMLAIIKNNGHQVEVKLKQWKQIPEIQRGGLLGSYKLDHLHFHWDSEHTVEGKRFPLEMHMVHYSEKYESYEEASKHTADGSVAVFAVLFHESSDAFEEFNPLLDAVKSVKNQINQERELESFVIKQFMPIDLSGYYRYNGSITTPGCDEGIIWTVFLHTLPISGSQVDIFREIRTHQNIVLEKNFRELQPLNKRQILLKLSPIESGSNIHVFKNINYFLLITYVMYY